MSWSTNAIGKPEKVAEKIAKNLSSIRCSEPEETVKNTVAQAIAAALATFPPTQAVKVVASGSQSSKGPLATNSLSVSVEPLWGFLE